MAVPRQCQWFKLVVLGGLMLLGGSAAERSMVSTAKKFVRMVHKIAPQLVPSIPPAAYRSNLAYSSRKGWTQPIATTMQRQQWFQYTPFYRQ